MKALLPKHDTNNGKMLDKEQTLFLELVACKKGEFNTPVTVRCWMGRSSQAHTVYCSIWVRDLMNRRWYAGHGQAGGYGYHRASAALQAALTSAEIELRGDCYTAPSEAILRDQPENFKQRAYIGGCGDHSMEAAILAVGVALGFKANQLYLVRG